MRWLLARPARRSASRLTSLVVALVTVFASLAFAPAPAQAAAYGTPLYCYETLNCSVADFQALSLDQRLVFIRALQDNQAQQFQGGFKDWRAIEGIIEFFQAKGLGGPGTWVSYTDAGILHGIERGIAMSTNKDSYGDEGNPGADKWQTFLLDLQAGRLGNPVDHDREWGQAEQASTDYGAHYNGYYPSTAENIWFQFSQIFRWIMQNEATLYDAPVVGGLVFRNILPGFAQVTDASKTFFWASLSWNLSVTASLTPAILNDINTHNYVQLGSDLWQLLNSTCTDCSGGGQNPPSIWSGPCSGYTCDDLDPTLSWNASTGASCSGSATTVVAVPADGGTLQMRWGPNCQVNWARFTPNSNGGVYYIWVGRQSPGWNTPGYEFTGTSGVAAFSNQVYAPGAARVCVLQWTGSTWGNQVCTNWY